MKPQEEIYFYMNWSSLELFRKVLEIYTKAKAFYYIEKSETKENQCKFVVKTSCINKTEEMYLNGYIDGLESK